MFWAVVGTIVVSNPLKPALSLGLCDLASMTVYRLSEDGPSRRYLTINWWDEGNVGVCCPLNRTVENARMEMASEAYVCPICRSYRRRARRRFAAKVDSCGLFTISSGANSRTTACAVTNSIP